MATLTFEPIEAPADFSVEEEFPDFYEEGCEQMWDAKGNPLPNGEVCGGKVVSTGGHGYYNGSYQCYTMYLRCEKCGDYEVECV